MLTGLEALSRERDVSRVMQLGQIIQVFGPEAADNLRLNKILARATVGLGFADVVRTDEEIQKLQQARQEQAMAQQMAGPAAGQLAKAATEE